MLTLANRGSRVASNVSESAGALPASRPARVIVRPFKPATEPRDLNPTDKTRANHIVERVLALDTSRGRPTGGRAGEFRGRHRNLLATFELRANDMEQALAAHGSFSEIQRQLIGAYFLNEYSFEASALFNPASCRIPTSREFRQAACASSSACVRSAKVTCRR